MDQGDIGLIGLAVMGQNLVLNMESRGFKVSVFNRTTSKVDEFLKGPAKGKDFIGCHSVEELCQSLKRPRKVMMMVKAGEAIDSFIELLLPHLEEGDILIDGGNSNYPDSTRRCKELKAKGILFVGAGVSGGEEGALKGPSIMPGGNRQAWEHLKPIFQAIAAKSDNQPCCDWVGEDGSGHFVKMVHNGIEYGDMQLICEAFQILRDILGLSYLEMHGVFKQWNTEELNSYLIEITRDILIKADSETNKPLLEIILDTAGQKGTGKWTAISALDTGVPVTLIGEAVFSRCLSAQKEERIRASKVLNGPIKSEFKGDKQKFIQDIKYALLASKVISYAQGYILMREVAKENGWKLNFGSIALMWRGGCIIRSTFLGDIKSAFDKNPHLENLVLDDYFKNTLKESQTPWRRVLATAIMEGIPTPAMSAALAYYDGYRTERLPANLLQAQRDFFGAHTYERVDKPRGEFFHTEWIND